VTSGVIKSDNNGYFQFYNSHIYHNRAFSAPISEMLDSLNPSIISNCTIYKNNHFSKDDILAAINDPNYGLFQTFIDYINENTDMFDGKSIKNAFYLITSQLSFQDYTTITDQDFLLYSIYSQVQVNGLIVADTDITNDVFYIAESSIDFKNIKISNVHSESLTNFFSVAYSSFIFQNITYKNSNVTFVTCSFSKGSFDRIYVNDLVNADYLLYFRSSEIFTFKNSNFKDISTGRTHGIMSTISVIGSIENVTMTNFWNSAIELEKSTVSSIANLNITNSKRGILASKSSLGIIQDSYFRSNGDTNTLYGGAAYLYMTNATFISSTFINNTAHEGGGVYLTCISSPFRCQTAFTNNTFTNNKAMSKGAGIYYDSDRPQIQGNLDTNNQASYGPNIASYATRIVLKETSQNKINISDVASGIKHTELIEVELVDYDGQVMVLENEKIVKITPDKAGVEIKGTDYAKFKQGKATFDNLIFIAKPGLLGIIYNLTSKAIDFTLIKHGLDSYTNNPEEFVNNFIVDFRYCKPGERELENNQ
jgi:hypothetical protein